MIRGPSSSVYGTAFFAVVNIVTRAPERGAARAPRPPSSRARPPRRLPRGGGGAERKAGLLEVSAYAVAVASPGPDVHFTTDPAAAEPGRADATNGLALGTDYEAGHNTGLLVRYRQLSLQAPVDGAARGLPSAPGDAIFNDPYNSVKDNHGFVELRLPAAHPERHPGAARVLRPCLRHRQSSTAIPPTGPRTPGSPAIRTW